MAAGYQQYCPIAKGAEILAERWTPLIVRNLHLGCHTFSEIHRGCPRMSTTLLTQRLHSLERDGVIQRQPQSNGRGWLYHLTPSGEELVDVVLALGIWGALARPRRPGLRPGRGPVGVGQDRRGGPATA